MESVETTGVPVTERLEPGKDTWYRDAADHLARYLHAVEFVEGKRVLDAGTGHGYGAAILKAKGALHVQAIDIDESAIAKARELYPIEGIEYLVDDCERLANVRGALDVVCNFENIEHLAHPDRFLQAAAGLLTDDGVLLCSSPDRATSPWKDGRPCNPYHVNEWYRDEFHDLLSSHFDDVEVLSQIASLGFISRWEAVHVLTEHLRYLWSAPLPRLARALGKLMGRPRNWIDVNNLATPSFSDFMVVPSSIANILGKPVCHYAVCRSPRR
jgi:SAM-dependent methyltransferase